MKTTIVHHTKEMVERQRDFFQSGGTRDIDFRINQLKRIRTIVNDHEDAILDALSKDLHKPAFEGYSTEIMPIINEIQYAVKNIKAWSKPKKVKTPLELMPARSEIHSHPYGVVLNIAPWNYPFQLCFGPLVPILAAGNCAVIKPSEYSPHTSSLVARLIRENFPSHYCAVIEGGVEETQDLLRQRWDHITFTGNPVVGRIVAQAASHNLTPVLLELGGKSPCIVHHDADLKVAARRIVWGKFFNAGQTCTAPDFLLVEKRVADRLKDEIVKQIKLFYGDDPQKSPDYCRIINKRHFDRLVSLLNSDTIMCGGGYDENSLYIEPTIFHNLDFDDRIMEEEIFGPLLPVLQYTDIEDVIGELLKRESPLALYLFTNNRRLQDRIITDLPFGGGVINSTLLQTANIRLPFGGIGNSGMGSYHGKAGFDTFSHQKSIVHKPTILDQTLVYPPYKEKVKFLKLFS